MGGEFPKFQGFPCDKLVTFGFSFLLGNMPATRKDLKFWSSIQQSWA